MDPLTLDEMKNLLNSAKSLLEAQEWFDPETKAGAATLVEELGFCIELNQPANFRKNHSYFLFLLAKDRIERDFAAIKAAAEELDFTTYFCEYPDPGVLYGDISFMYAGKQIAVVTADLDGYEKAFLVNRELAELVAKNVFPQKPTYRLVKKFFGADGEVVIPGAVPSEEWPSVILATYYFNTAYVKLLLCKDFSGK